MLVLGGISIMGTKPRVPIAPTSRPAPLPPIDLKFTVSPLFVAVVSYTHRLCMICGLTHLKGFNDLSARIGILLCIPRTAL